MDFRSKTVLNADLVGSARTVFRSENGVLRGRLVLCFGQGRELSSWVFTLHLRTGVGVELRHLLGSVLD